MGTRRATPRNSSTERRDLARLGHHPKKRLGQHFLRDQATAERIVTLGALDTGTVVVEIGPGLGILSDLLVRAAARVILVEIDADLAAHLTARYRDFPRVQVMHEDALRVDFDRLLANHGPAVAIGNLPYNVATPILQRLVEQRARFRRFVLMLQREVAERITAAPGSRAYGALSVLTQLHCDAHLALDVGPDCFVPRPQVSSAVVVFDPLPGLRVDVADPGRFARLVRALFQHRRKQLGNAARGVLASPVAALRAAGIDPTRRPETLSIEELARLARQDL